jgi:3-methyladenine DNA glycosylase/8-oxoguanine DNA glycosylase
MAWLDDDMSPTDARRSTRRGDRDAAAARSGFRTRVADAVMCLRKRDPVLSGLIDIHGPCTLVPSSPYFPVLVETVISQQLSTKAAKAIYRRLLGAVGRRVLRPIDVLRIADEILLEIGFSRSKTRYVKNAAEAFYARRMGPKTFGRMTDDEVIDYLSSIKGIGEWSSHMFLIFALGRMDVFPVGDLGLRNAMANAYRLRRPPSQERLERIGDQWRPYRTIGTWYLWESYDNG